MTLGDSLGWIANIGFIVGAIELTKRKKIGFIYQLIANLICMVVGIILELTSLIAISIVLMAINFKGYIDWRKSELE